MTGMRQRREPAARDADAPAPARGQDRDDRGETLALLVLWPALLVAILVLLVHAFIVANAQAEAEVAASAGLRAAWRSAANEDFLTTFDDATGNYLPPSDPASDYTGPAPHPKVLEMADAAQDAVARAAATHGGWRWWTPGVAVVQSDWCAPSGPDRPGQGDPGWVRVVVSGEVFGPLAALWPDRLDRVYAAAMGPAVIASVQSSAGGAGQVPAELPDC